jgi:hypothetical protein
MQRRCMLSERGWVLAKVQPDSAGGIGNGRRLLTRVPLGFGNADAIGGTQSKWAAARHEPQITCVRFVG